MKHFILAPAALEDLHDIWNYFAREVGDADLADQMQDELILAIQVVAKNPGLGHFRSDLSAERLRFWRCRSYLILYRDSSPIEIVRVLHGARDIHSILEAQ